MVVPIGRRVPLILVFLIIAIVLWLWGGLFFPEYWEAEELNVGVTVSFYVFIFFVMIFIADARIQKDLRSPLSTSALPYLVSFVITLIVVSGLLVNPEQIPATWILPILIIQISLVAPAEELMFRGVLFSYLGYNIFGNIAQASFFSLFHYVVATDYLKLAPTNMEVIFILITYFAFGILMGFLVRDKRWGLPATMACHAALNVAIMGAFII